MKQNTESMGRISATKQNTKSMDRNPAMKQNTVSEPDNNNKKQRLKDMSSLLQKRGLQIIQ